MRADAAEALDDEQEGGGERVGGDGNASLPLLPPPWSWRTPPNLDEILQTEQHRHHHLHHHQPHYHQQQQLHRSALQPVVPARLPPPTDTSRPFKTSTNVAARTDSGSVKRPIDTRGSIDTRTNALRGDRRQGGNRTGAQSHLGKGARPPAKVTTGTSKAAADTTTSTAATSATETDADDATFTLTSPTAMEKPPRHSIVASSTTSATILFQWPGYPEPPSAAAISSLTADQAAAAIARLADLAEHSQLIEALLVQLARVCRKATSLGDVKGQREAGQRGAGQRETMKDTGLAQDIFRALEGIGGVRGVVRAMRCHVPVEGVQAAGCTLVRLLCQTEALKDEALECGVCSAACAALTAHANASAVQAAGFRLLAHLASVTASPQHSDERRSQACVDEGVFSIASTALRTHLASDSVVQWGILAVIRLTASSVQRTYQAVRTSGLLAALKRARQDEAGEQPAQRRGLAAKAEITYRFLSLHDSRFASVARHDEGEEDKTQAGTVISAPSPPPPPPPPRPSPRPNAASARALNVSTVEPGVPPWNAAEQCVKSLVTCLLMIHHEPQRW